MLLLLQIQTGARLSGHVAHKKYDECVYLWVAEFKRRDQLGEKLQIEEHY